jgi:hypothetical protein
MGILGPIVRPQPLLMRAGQAELPERRSIGGEFVGPQQLGCQAQFPEKLAHQPRRRAFVPPALNQHAEDLALVINGAL